jgi:hypothetical protein
LLGYRPRVYPGQITLFRARERFLRWDPTLGWEGLANEGVALNVIPGSAEELLKEPNVHILAGELRTCLVEAYSRLDEMSDTAEAEFVRHPELAHSFQPRTLMG